MSNTKTYFCNLYSLKNILFMNKLTKDWVIKDYNLLLLLSLHISQEISYLKDCRIIINDLWKNKAQQRLQMKKKRGDNNIMNPNFLQLSFHPQNLFLLKLISTSRGHTNPNVPLPLMILILKVHTLRLCCSKFSIIGTFRSFHLGWRPFC